MRITIKPGEGRRVPMPAGYGLLHGALLPDGGLEVERTAFILKMLADGDVVQVDTAAQPPATAPGKPAPSPQAPANPSNGGTAS